MRRILSLASSILLALQSAACVSGPRPEDVLAVGFRTPELAFASFQTAFRGNLVDLEYRCFSNRLKEQMGSQVFYRVERKRILSEQPFIKLAASARVIAVEHHPNGRQCLLRVQIRNLFFKHTFAVELVEEGFYDVFDEDGVAEGVPERWSNIASTQWNSSADKLELILRVPMPEGYESVDELTGFIAGRAWKINAFVSLETP